VADEKVLRRALVYLRLVAKPDPRSRYLPFHEQAVASIRQAPSLAKRHEAGVYRLAKRLRGVLGRDLGTDTPELPFDIIDHQKGYNCVQVGGLNLPRPVEEAFREEKASVFISERKYNLQTWTKDRPEHRRRRLEENRRKAERTTRRHDDLPDRVEKLQKSLNGLQKQRFTKLFKRAKPRLEELALKRQEESAADGDGSVPYRNQLRAIADNPIPLYKFTARTLRLAPAGPSLAALPTEMRRAVFEDYLEVDMSSAQLALAASLWGDLKDLRDFLSFPSGADRDGNPQFQSLRRVRRGNADWKEVQRDWWHELTGWLNRELPSPKYNSTEDFGRVKGVLKSFTYGLFYGMQKSNLVTLGTPHAETTDQQKYFDSVEMMCELFLGPCPHPRKIVSNIGETLFRHPLVEQLLQKRDEMLSRIEESGSITDCFGRSIETGEDRDAKSVLAEYMQNAELRVMLPVAETVLDDDEMRFGLWQHDGVTVAPRRRKAWAYNQVHEKISAALREGCRNLADALDSPPIETTLTIDYGKEYLSC